MALITLATDDMQVIIYKILAYLYSCMKNGIKPDRDRYSHVAFGIPESYWNSIMLELHEHGYVRGLVIANDFGGDLRVAGCDPTITFEGIQYLQENSLMQKTKRFLQDTKSIIPGI